MTDTLEAARRRMEIADLARQEAGRRLEAARVEYDRCAYCGSSRNVTFYGNRPDNFMVRIGAWGAGRALCQRCVAIENRRALQGKRSPRFTARILRALRGL